VCVCVCVRAYVFVNELRVCIAYGCEQCYEQQFAVDTQSNVHSDFVACCMRIILT
jgi:hypothetical protein